MKKLRIAQITNLQEAIPPKNQHGLEQLVYDLTEELIDLGHEVTLFASADSKTRAKLVPIWPHAVRHDDPFDRLLDSQTYATWSISEAFNRHTDFDILHSHAGFVATHFAGSIPEPVISTAHGPISYEFVDKFPPEYQEYFREIEQKHFAKAHTVTVSEFQAKRYHRPVVTIHNGIRLSDWPKFSTSEGKYFAFLGYITRDKGVAQAVQAILPTSEKLLIAGPLDKTPENQRYFNEEIKPFLNDRIQYVGPLEFSAKQKFLQEAKALLMPSQWDEPFGLVAIESLASGTPVIGFNRAAMPEIVEDGTSGFVVNDVEEMTEKISQVGSISRQNCRNRFEEKFTASVMAKKYEDLYYSLLTEK